MAHHLIFEGAELAGKSWVMSQIYNKLEPLYSQSADRLDGCFWLNADIGVFGTKAGTTLLHSYLKILESLNDRNVIVEKFHISQNVYSKLYEKKNVSINAIDKALGDIGYKIIMLVFPENETLISQRLQDRINIYPTYSRIAKTPNWYIEQQRLYVESIKKSNLPYLIVEAEYYPDTKVVEKILEFIKEE